MSKYVELVCGDTSVLLSEGESATSAALHETRKKLLYEYASLSDSAGMKIMLTESEKRERANAELTLFQVLANLLQLQAYDDVRKVLRDYGIARTMDNKQLSDEVGRLLKRAKTNFAKVHKQEDQVEEEPLPDEIRAQFDKQAASLMTYYKFQIDFSTIPASQFACMLEKANKEIKARLAAMNHKR